MAPPRKTRVLPPGVEHARLSAVLMVVGLIVSSVPLPWTAAAVAPLAWAAVESVRAIRAIRATPGGKASTRTMVSSIIGLVLVCLLTAVVLLPYAVYGPAKGLQDCTDAANTAVAAADCQSQFRGGLESVFGGLLSAG